jgi:2-C-methyl-D-erythritol 4-phosphate cytidylyltransferase
VTVRIQGLAVPVSAVIAAAGTGQRVGGGTAKQFLLLRGVPVLVRAVRLFVDCPLVDEVVVVASDFPRTKELVGALPKVTRIVAGGESRQESVWRGLQQVTARPRVIAVHDAARPLLPPDILEQVLLRSAEHPAQVVAVPVSDTVKIASPDGRVAETPDRRSLWAAQTPQVFRAELLMAAYRQAMQDGYVGTDCASLAERSGVPVTLFPGSPENLKLTTPADFDLAESILARREGQG